MNRQQRRAAAKSHSTSATATSRGEFDELYSRAVWNQQNGNRREATRAYKRALTIAPNHPAALNNLGCLLIEDGKHAEASELFARLVGLTPELADDFGSIRATLCAVNPQLEATLAQAASTATALEDICGHDTLDAIRHDPLLSSVLTTTTIRAVDLERLLTLIRRDALHRSLAGGIASSELPFLGALAQQCFINEYVFAQRDDEAQMLARLRHEVSTALTSGAPVAPSALASLAMYAPLHALPGIEQALAQHWPAAIADVLTQQVVEPAQERAHRNDVPRLTPIDDDTSRSVREQYEDNPYPRWVRTAAAGAPIDINDYVRAHCPNAAFVPIETVGDALQVLVPGCGTGRHPIELAQTLANARLLAVDLSLSSLAYAKRKTHPALAIDYAQADILNLGGITRRFDVIDASGVLHHMADPLAGWRVLLSLLRPNGLMRVGLYSEIGRRDVVAARAFIAERGFQPTPEDIRRCRQDILASPLAKLARHGDFFSTSECRDMLFHVQERRFTLPMIKEFLSESGLRFIAFVLAPQAREQFRARFAASGWSLSDLDRWHQIESANPDSFAGMYQFWVQKR